MIELAFPYALFLLPVPWLVYNLMPPIKGMYGDALKIPFLSDLKRLNLQNGGIWKNANNGQSAMSKKFFFLYLVWLLLCLSLARPQIGGEPQRLPDTGRNIMLVLDISTSMMEADFAYHGQRITRLDAVKNVVYDFVKKRSADRIGLVLFGTRAYMQAPLTYDKAAIEEILYSMQAGMAGDSTSIGDALALALKNMQIADNDKDQIIILLTDGENNDGSLSMAEAIKLASQENIKIYTIGVGSPNLFLQMLTAVGLQKIDESELSELAKVTKGQYFRAESTEDLQKVYHLIDKMEPREEEGRYVQEVKEIYYIPLALAWLLAIGITFMLRGKKNG